MKLSLAPRPFLVALSGCALLLAGPVAIPAQPLIPPTYDLHDITCLADGNPACPDDLDKHDAGTGVVVMITIADDGGPAPIGSPCTGFLVDVPSKPDPAYDYVLTAWHCIGFLMGRNHPDDPPPTDVDMWAGFDATYPGPCQCSGVSPPALCSAASCDPSVTRSFDPCNAPDVTCVFDPNTYSWGGVLGASPTRDAVDWTPDPDAGERADWALVKIPVAPGATTRNYFTLKPSAGLPAGHPVYVVQHPQLRPKEIALGTLYADTGTMQAPSGTVRHLADVQGFSSGAPIIDAVDDEVIGISTYYTSSSNGGLSTSGVLIAGVARAVTEMIDTDGDLTRDTLDNCPNTANADQADADNNGVGDACDFCANGILDAGEACDDGGASDGDGCSSACQIEECWECSGEPSTCSPSPVSTACGVGSLCVTSATCDGLGTCIGGTPPTGCFAAGKGAFKIKDDVDTGVGSKDKMTWKWLKGDDTVVGDFLEPVTGAAGYSLCLTADIAGTPTLLKEWRVLPGGMCDGKPCWAEAGTTGYKFKDKTGPGKGGTPDGISIVKLKASTEGKGKALWKGKGQLLQDPSPPYTTPVMVQFVADDGVTTKCWETTFDLPKKNGDGKFVGKTP